jgi:hypothetical protein
MRIAVLEGRQRKRIPTLQQLFLLIFDIILNLRFAHEFSRRNLLIILSTLAPGKDRALFARWVVLAFELAVLNARSLLDSVEAERYLSSSNLLVASEWNSMVEGARHVTVWYWIQSKAKQLHDRREIAPDQLQTICQAVDRCRAESGDLMGVISRDQPPPYVFVCGVLVNLYLWLQSTAQGIHWATWMNDAAPTKMYIFTEPRLYCDIIVQYMTTAIFAMLFGKYLPC